LGKDEEGQSIAFCAGKMGNTFGHLFRITTFGESHGGGVGVVIDGCPPLLEISEAEIQVELDRRKPGQSKITTPRKEEDICEILSGVFEGKTTGTSIAILVRNKDARSQDYDEMAVKYRPSHADATYDAKYGIRTWQGGGRSSARETIGRVAAGAIAKKILARVAEVEIVAYVKRIKDIEAAIDPSNVTLEQVESNIVRCPDSECAEKMIELIDRIRKEKDSLGGVVECVVRNVPKGLGEPVFDKLEADLAKAVMSLPATKGFEIGSGFAGTTMTGSEHNDEFYVDENGETRTVTNRSGGVQGGISNGENILMRIAFKPTATIGKEQKTVTREGEETLLAAKGRHDPCVLPRAVPMVEAMVALVLCDHLLRDRGQCSVLPKESYSRS
jgi:chorismate synthase